MSLKPHNQQLILTLHHDNTYRGVPLTFVESEDDWAIDTNMQKMIYVIYAASSRVLQWVEMISVKVRTFWEAHKIWKNLPYGFEKSADLLQRCRIVQKDEEAQ